MQEDNVENCIIQPLFTHVHVKTQALQAYKKSLFFFKTAVVTTITMEQPSSKNLIKLWGGGGVGGGGGILSVKIRAIC